MTHGGPPSAFAKAPADRRRLRPEAGQADLVRYSLSLRVQVSSGQGVTYAKRGHSKRV